MGRQRSWRNGPCCCPQNPRSDERAAARKCCNRRADANPASALQPSTRRNPAMAPVSSETGGSADPRYARASAHRSFPHPPSKLRAETVVAAFAGAAQAAARRAKASDIAAGGGGIQGLRSRDHVALKLHEGGVILPDFGLGARLYARFRTAALREIFRQQSGASGNITRQRADAVHVG